MCAPTEPFADGAQQRLDAVDDLARVAEAAAYLGVGRADVTVAAGLAQRRAVPEVARGAGQSLVDRPGQPGIATAGVAHRGEPAPEGQLQPAGTGQSHVAERDRFDEQAVETNSVGMAVGVDQAGYDHPAAGVDDDVGVAHRVARRVADADDATVDRVDRAVEQLLGHAVEHGRVDDGE